MQLRDQVGALISSVLANALAVGGIAAVILPPNSQLTAYSRTEWVVIYAILGGIAGGSIHLLTALLIILYRKYLKRAEPGHVAGLAFTVTLVVIVVFTLLENHAAVSARLR